MKPFQIDFDFGDSKSEDLTSLTLFPRAAIGIANNTRTLYFFRCSTTADKMACIKIESFNTRDSLGIDASDSLTEDCYYVAIFHNLRIDYSIAVVCGDNVGITTWNTKDTYFGYRNEGHHTAGLAVQEGGKPVFYFALVKSNQDRDTWIEYYRVVPEENLIAKYYSSSHNSHTLSDSDRPVSVFAANGKFVIISTKDVTTKMAYSRAYVFDFENLNRSALEVTFDGYNVEDFCVFDDGKRLAISYYDGYSAASLQIINLDGQGQLSTGSIILKDLGFSLRMTFASCRNSDKYLTMKGTIANSTSNPPKYGVVVLDKDKLEVPTTAIRRVIKDLSIEPAQAVELGDSTVFISWDKSKNRYTSIGKMESPQFSLDGKKLEAVTEFATETLSHMVDVQHEKALGSSMHSFAQGDFFATE